MDETPAELPPWDDDTADALALIECWSAVDAAESGSEAERQATVAAGVLLKHLGNAYATSLTLAKVLSQVRQAWLTCDSECCRQAGPAEFRQWFTELARSG